MIYFDIETAAADNAAEFLAEPKPPGSMKKAETIAAWERDEKPGIIAKLLDEAALSPITGKVLAVGVLHDAVPHLIHGEDEGKVLADFWTLYREFHAPGDVEDWVGFNIASFDLPFLWKRSIINGVKTPPLFSDRGYPLNHFRDLRQVWQCGDRQAHGSLDVIARLCGFTGKTGNGAEFAKLYRDAATRQKALDYLLNDLMLTKLIAIRFGVA